MSESKVSTQVAPGKGVGRRELFLRSAALFGAGTLLTGSLSAQTAPTDLSLLNYALTLENLEAAFYTQGLAQFVVIIDDQDGRVAFAHLLKIALISNP